MEQDSSKEEVPPTIQEEKDGNKAVLQQYQQLLVMSKVLTTKMSGNECKRVLRSILKAPFEAPDKFVSKDEVELYRMGLAIMEIKFLLVADQVKTQVNLAQALQEANKLEQEDKGETQNG